MAQCNSVCGMSRRGVGTILVSLSLGLGIGTGSVSAQTFSWSGAGSGSGNYLWSGSDNWLGGVTPPAEGGSTVQLLFDGAPAVAHSTNNLDKFFVHQIRFGTNAAAYVIDNVVSEQFLIFAPNAGNTPSLINDSHSTHSLLHNIYFDNGLNIGGTGSGGVDLGSNIFGRGVLAKSGPTTVTLNSPTGDIQLSRLDVTGGVFNITRGTKVHASPSIVSTVSGATVNITGAGSELRGLFHSTANGYINVSNGGKLSSVGPSNSHIFWGRTVVVEGDGSQWVHSTGTASGALFVRGNQTSVMIQNGGAMTSSGQLFIESDAVFTVNGGTVAVASLESINATGRLYLSDSGQASALTITNANSEVIGLGYDGLIADAASGAGSITLLGGRQIINSLNNTYSGGTRILGGEVVVAGNGSLGTGGVHIDGGALIFANDATLDERPLTFGAKGAGLGSGGTLTIERPLNLTVPLTITEGGVVRLTGVNQFNNTLNLFSGTLELTNDADATLHGALMGSSGSLVKKGTGIFTLTQAVGEGSVYAQVVVEDGAIRLRNPNALKDMALVLNKENGVIFDLGSSPTTVRLRSIGGSGNLDLGNHSLYIEQHGPYAGSINGAGSVTFGRDATLTGVHTYTGGTFYQNGNLTLTPSNITGNITYLGGFGGRLELFQPTDATFAGALNVPYVVKTGVGKLTLPGADYSGIEFELREGILALGAAPNGQFSGNPIHLWGRGATFQALSDGAFIPDVIQSATLDTNGHSLYSEFVFSSLRNQAIITKAGGGTWTIGQVSAYGINLEEGVIEFVPSDFPIYNVGSLSIADGATLRGVVDLQSLILLHSGGMIAPGLLLEPIGTLSTRLLSWDNGGILQFNLGRNGRSDHLIISDSLLKGANGDQEYLFDFSSANPVDGSLYQLLTFGTTDFQVSDFGYFGLRSGASGVFEMQGNSLFFRTSVAAAAPEPGVLSLIGCTLVLLRPALRRRKETTRKSPAKQR